MSRPVNISDSLTFNPAAFVSGSYASISGETTPIGKSSSSTSYAQVNLTTGSSATTEAIWSFDCSSIPAGATISSVTCSCKCSINSTNSSRITTRQAQLYSGTTAKGTAYTVANSTTAFNITCGSWTRAELQNARIRLYAVRGTSNTSTNYYFRFYGADVTVNYSISGTEYEVSISNTSETVTSDPSTTQYVFQGENQEITFYNISSLDDIEITDNNTNVNSSLVYKTSISTVFSANPSSISGSNGTITDGNNGLTGTDSNTYARLRLLSGTYLEYSFNTSNIPSDATITSISCKAKGCLTTGSAYGNYQLYSGSTAKGSTTPISPSNNVIIQDLTCGTWTRNELSDCRIRIISTYTRNSEYYANFYGADLTVNYTVSGQFYTYTISNISADHAIVIADVPSVTYFTFTCTDNSDNGNITPTGTQNIEEGQNVVYTLTSSDFSLIKLTDNGVDVTNQIVYSSTTSSGSPMFIPSDFINDDFTVETYNGVTYGYTDTSSDTYCRLNTTPRTTGASGMFIISVTGIPSGAIIDSVSCKVKGRKMGSDANILSTAQLYSGNTAKGSAYTFTGTYTTHIADLDAGTWTVEELQNVGIKIISTVSSSSASAWSFDFFGAEFTVTYHTTQGYTYNILNASTAHTLELVDFNESLYLKVNGQFVKCTKIYKKINNVWTEVTLDSLTTPGIYIKK